jgi:glycosyltransferase involved in cell wall biosynthesis
MLDPYSLSVKHFRKAAYFWAIERRNISCAQRVIYTTSEEARLASKTNPLTKFAIVPLGANAPENTEHLSALFLKKFPKARGRRQLLFLGRLHFKKGLDRVLNALPAVVRSFPEVLLTVVGDGSPDFQNTLARSISMRALENHILLTGRLEGALKWGAYASAELFLLPSRQENFAITVAEAMQMGLPVIISDRVNTWPYVREAGAGLIVGEGAMKEGLENGLLSLLGNSHLMRTMGKAGYAYSRKHLTWQSAADCLFTCYDEAIESFAAK